MIIGIPDNHNVVAGRSQGYLGLPMRVQKHNTSLKDGRVFESDCMITKWIPTKEELARLAMGEAIYIRMLGSVPPPMMVGVGDPDVYEW